jgi:hypothetical protein
MRTIVIYGAGERGRKFLREFSPMLDLLSPGAEKFFCDGNAKLQGNTVDGLVVLAPTQLYNFDREETLIVIASNRYSEIFFEIKRYEFVNLYYLNSQDKPIPLDTSSILIRNEEAGINSRVFGNAEYAFFESYKFITEAKFKEGTLFDEPVFGYRRHLYEFFNIHKGHRCFVIGNGPSLNKIDISMLKDEITFGSNFIYRAFPQWGFTTKYWALLDELFFYNYIENIVQDLPDQIVKFFRAVSRHAEDFKSIKNVVPVNLSPHLKNHLFSLNPSVIYSGANTTHVLLQIAAIMGCNPIYMVGVDNYFPSFANDEKMEGFHAIANRDSDHFMPRYGLDRYNLGYFSSKGTLLFEEAYLVAFEELRRHGVELYNASPGTKVESVPKIEFEDIFKRKSIL